MTRGALLALFLVALPLSQAAAGPIPEATYSIQLNNAAEITVPGSYGSGDTAEISLVPEPSVHAHVSGVGRSVIQMMYWFRIDGPTEGIEVPIQIAGHIEINAAGAVFQKDMIWGVSASLIAQSFTGQLGGEFEPLDNQFAEVGCNPLSVGNIPTPPPIGSCAAVSQSEDVVLSLRVRSGADNRIVLNASANNQESFVAGFDSLVDPIISFAPGFDPTGFTIAVSEGVGNTVPEPPAALLGLAPLLISLLRRRE